MSDNYDAILVVSFGGPEGHEDVMPFLENVTRGRNVPRERLLEVAGHYYHFGGVSPINQQTRELIAAIKIELQQRGIPLPIYWGNRNWHPFLADTMRQMTANGVKRALAFVVAGYSSYSSCRQYRENIEQARQVVGDGAPIVDKIRVFYNHPHFVATNIEHLAAAIEEYPTEDRSGVRVAFTAHSIPMSMADKCRYEHQLTEASRLTAEGVGILRERWKLVFQSRSGRPEDPWLEPDIVDHLKHLAAEGVKQVVVMPIGFLSDHLEVLYDLDHEAAHAATELGMKLVRAKTPGIHQRFVSMIGELIAERLDPAVQKCAVGMDGASHDVCPVDCCPAPMRPGVGRPGG